MIANIANTLIGICLVYVAVLDPALLKSGLTLSFLGLAVLLLSLWARQTDYLKWHSSANTVLALLLLVTAAEQMAIPVELLTYWIVFWIGIAVAIIALWGALYQPVQ